MKMIAIGTVHGHKLVRDANPKDPKSRAKYDDLLAKPGEAFDTADFGIDDDEAERLIKTGVAKRKMREVADDGETKKEGQAAA